MKITLAEMPLARGFEHGEEPTDVRIRCSKEVQVASLLRSPQAKVFDRGNLQTSLVFKVKKQHNSREAAVRYAFEQGRIYANLKGSVTIELEGYPESQYLLHDACIKRSDTYPQGVATHHAYEIVGGNFELITLEKNGNR